MRATNTAPQGQINAPDHLDCMSTLRTDNSQTLVNALAEIERLKAIHEVNADTLNAMQVEIEQRDAEIERLTAQCEGWRQGQKEDLALQVEQHKEIQRLTTALNQKVKLSEWEELVADNERKTAALRQVLTILEEEYVMPDEIDTAIATIKKALA